jgi:hypothetical protein
MNCTNLSYSFNRGYNLNISSHNPINISSYNLLNLPFFIHKKEKMRYLEGENPLFNFRRYSNRTLSKFYNSFRRYFTLSSPSIFIKNIFNLFITNFSYSIRGWIIFNKIKESFIIDIIKLNNFRKCHYNNLLDIIFYPSNLFRYSLSFSNKIFNFIRFSLYEKIF